MSTFDLPFWAFRYALGRSSYAVNDVVGGIHRELLWNNVDLDTRTKMIQEIDEAIEQGKAGMPMDRDAWQGLRDQLVRYRDRPPAPPQGTWWRLSPDRAVHPVPINALEEKCRCGKPAAHKIGEESAPSNFHNMTAYICCKHFREFIGQCVGYPYPDPIEVSVES